MIYTITLNPALDRNIWIERVMHDDSNRIHKEECKSRCYLAIHSGLK